MSIENNFINRHFYFRNTAHNQIRYEIGKNPVLLRCPRGHVCAVSGEDFNSLGELGSYFECTWCSAMHGEIVVLAKNMRTNKAKWGL